VATVNISNLESLLAVAQAASDEKSPAIIAVTLRLAFKATIWELLANSSKEFDPRKILWPAKEAMKEVVKGKMRLFGSSGKA
jgi:fructose-bisphosphate aldolase class II